MSSEPTLVDRIKVHRCIEHLWAHREVRAWAEKDDGELLATIEKYLPISPAGRSLLAQELRRFKRADRFDPYREPSVFGDGDPLVGLVGDTHGAFDPYGELAGGRLCTARMVCRRVDGRRKRRKRRRTSSSSMWFADWKLVSKARARFQRGIA